LGPDGRQLTIEELAKMIRALPRWHDGHMVRLDVCWAGRGDLIKLSKLLGGSMILASTGPVWFLDNGDILTAPRDPNNPDHWDVNNIGEYDFYQYSRLELP